jgi:hypothetical protein
MFPRQELRETSGHFLDGLLSGIERQTGWLIAERAGLARAYRIVTYPVEAINGKRIVAAQAARSRLMILRLTEARRNYFWSCLYLKSRLFAAKRGALRLSANADELALNH